MQNSSDCQTSSLHYVVPHNFGVSQAPIINSFEMIQHKREILDNLIELEIAQSLMNEEIDDQLNPIDVRYNKLKTEINAIDHNSDEFLWINAYVQDTHGKTHDQYTLEVVDIFTVHRQEERHCYEPFRNFHNRQLLWHGSRSSNYVGILSEGLKIAPPNVPITGYMFGKGKCLLYFISKNNFQYTFVF